MFLFDDEVPVSEAEVEEWLDNIPNLSSAPFRRKYYRKAYRVEDKIRALKIIKAKGGKPWDTNIQSTNGTTKMTTGAK